MRRLIRTFGLCLLVAGLGAPTLALADDAASRRAAAEAYIAATGGFAVQIETTVDALALRLPADHQAPFRAFMAENLDAAEIEALAVDGMVRHFTSEELEALTAFYGSELGRSIAAKFPLYFADTMAEVQEVVTAHANAFEP